MNSRISPRTGSGTQLYTPCSTMKSNGGRSQASIVAEAAGVKTQHCRRRPPPQRLGMLDVRGLKSQAWNSPEGCVAARIRPVMPWPQPSSHHVNARSRCGGA